MSRRKFKAPDLNNPAVRIAAQMVIDHLPPNDEARSEFERGFFDIREMPPEYIFDLLVLSIHNHSRNQQAKPAAADRGDA